MRSAKPAKCSSMAPEPSNSPRRRPAASSAWISKKRIRICVRSRGFRCRRHSAITSSLTAEVAGEKVKPVEGPDGNRVPLLRPGFRPTDSYNVSFVFIHSGAPFAKKGGSDISLPKMDIPIDLLQWEVFLPERYKVKDFGGDAIAANLLPPASQDVSGAEEFDNLGFFGRVGSMSNVPMVAL